MRARGPQWSNVYELVITPARLTSPNVGISPTTPQCDAGPRIDPPVSEPSATGTMPAATAAPEPVEEPPRPDELEENRPLKGDGEEEDEGLLFVGDRGKILCRFNGGNPKIIPQTKMDSYKQPPQTLPRSPGNEREWLDACKGGKVKPGGNFEFEGLVTETLLLGNVAVRSGQKLGWDHSNLKVSNSELQKYIHPERRNGWEL